jgi:hypothetical protein
MPAALMHVLGLLSDESAFPYVFLMFGVCRIVAAGQIYNKTRDKPISSVYKRLDLS